MLVSSIRLRAWHIASGVAVCFAFAYQLPEIVLTAYHDRYAGWTLTSPATLYIWTTVAPIACLGLFGLALWHVKHHASKSLPAMQIFQQSRAAFGSARPAKTVARPLGAARHKYPVT